MLGLVAKNAILIVDFTNARKATGVNTHDALIQTNHARLRPYFDDYNCHDFRDVANCFKANGTGAEMNKGLAWVLVV